MLVVERAAVNSQPAVRVQRAGLVVEGAVGERQRGLVGDDNPCWLSSPAALIVCVLTASIRPLLLLTACARGCRRGRWRRRSALVIVEDPGVDPGIACCGEGAFAVIQRRPGVRRQAAVLRRQHFPARLLTDCAAS